MAYVLNQGLHILHLESCLVAYLDLESNPRATFYCQVSFLWYAILYARAPSYKVQGGMDACTLNQGSMMGACTPGMATCRYTLDQAKYAHPCALVFLHLGGLRVYSITTYALGCTIAWTSI